MYIDVSFWGYGIYSFSDYKALLQLLIDSYGQSLECLCIPEHAGYHDNIFPLTDSLTSLKHMLLDCTTPQVTKNILTACPNLECLRSRTSFIEWQMLPKGFKKLQNFFEDFKGLNNLLCSPAVTSLEVVNSIKMTSEISYQSYRLSCLQIFEVTIDYSMTSCLTHLARILSFAPVLSKLTINIRVMDEIEPQVWIKVLSSCPTLTHLTVYLYEPFGPEGPLINVSCWQDDFAKTIVSKIKKLEHLHIGFHLSSDGLRLIAQLENLQYFHHEIHTENMFYDSVFDTDALIGFLSSSFDKKLKSYCIYIPPVDPCGKYLILKKSFYNFIEKMERKHSLRFDMRQDNRDCNEGAAHHNKIPGMIYVTQLKVDA